MIKRLSYAVLKLIFDGIILAIIGVVFFLWETLATGAPQLSMSLIFEALHKALSTLYIYFIGLGVIAAYVLGPAIFGVRAWVGFILSAIPFLLGSGFYLSAKINDLSDVSDWLIVSAIASVLLFVADGLFIRRHLR